MKLNLFGLVAISLVLASPGSVHADSAHMGMKLIQKETFTLNLYTHNIVTCRPGLADNGHNYPGPTSLEFNLSPSNSWAAGHFFNSTNFFFNTEKMGNFCSNYKQITDIANSDTLPAQVDRKVYEYNHLVAPDSGLKCLKALREEMTITIEGVAFTSVTEFSIGYASKPSDCKN